MLILKSKIVAPWCSGYYYCTISFNKAWTLVLRRFKSYSRRVGDSRWWGTLTMVPAGNKAKPFRHSTIPQNNSSIHFRNFPKFESKRNLVQNYVFLFLFSLLTLWHECSPVNLLHIFRTPFTKNTSGRLLLVLVTYNEKITWMKKRFLKWKTRAACYENYNKRTK